MFEFRQKIDFLLGKTHIEDSITNLLSPEFIKSVGPQSGVTFKNEKYTEFGDGYLSCIYINRYPQDPPNNWLATLSGIGNAITVFDIATDNPDTVKANLNRSMEEQDSRVNNAQSSKEVIDAHTLKDRLENMYYEVSQLGAVMKLLNTRIYIPGRELTEMENDVIKIIKLLESNKYKGGICLDECKSDFRALFLPYDIQNKTLYKRVGQPLLTDTLAAGNPFHFSKLSDPNGFYWGSTFVGSGGSVFWDMYHKTKTRLSYNLLLAGMMGSGKSTALKKLLVDRAIRGDKVRVFDVTGEYKTLVEHLGGKVISLDGDGNNIINALQILPSGDNPRTIYSAHIAKVATVYRFLNPEAKKSHILMLKRLLRKLYIEKGIVSQQGVLNRSINEFRASDFPVWGDLLELIKRELNAIDNGKAEVEVVSPEDEKDDFNEAEKQVAVTKFSAKQKQELLLDLELNIEDICTTYANIFNAHTCISDVYDEQIVCFDIKGLLEMEPEIFDAQLFLTLSLCWANCVTVGSKMKRMYDKGEIDFKDIKRFLIILDEAHRTINANKLTGVKQIEVMEREARKFFGGIALASQHINDFFPEDASQLGISAIKNLFSFSTYKLMLRQDASCKKTLATAFDGTFTENEIEQIPYLEMGEGCLSIAGDTNITFKIEVSAAELALFEGGA